MREINVSDISRTVANLFLQANYVIGDDVMDALGSAARHEPSSLGKHVLLQLMENNRAGAEESLCVCQDTGLAVVFLTVGQEVYLTGGSLTIPQGRVKNLDGFCLYHKNLHSIN
ncbi:MAG: fumarate hydratase, partial [Eubacteriales bacterium]|nr:fumarate hydratase [Eubacteriales bacterium]